MRFCSSIFFLLPILTVDASRFSLRSSSRSQNEPEQVRDLQTVAFYSPICPGTLKPRTLYYDVTFEMVFSSPVQCSITEEKDLGLLIQNAISEHDSLGGLVVGYAFNTVMCPTPEEPLPEPLPVDDQVIPDPIVDGARQRHLLSAGWTYRGGGACHGCHPDNRDGLSDADITLRSSSLAMAAMEDELSLTIGKMFADMAPAVPCLAGVDAGLKVLLTSTDSFDATQFGCATTP